MTIRLGILGLAHGHIDAYCRRWREEKALDVRLQAAWDHDSTRLQDAVQPYGVTPCTSVAALLQGDVDAVIIAAETSMHADLTVQAAQAGKVIILQKPMALTISEADRIVEAVDRAGVPFTMAWQMRVDPENLRMRELIEGGKFGRILQVRRRHCLPVLLNESFHTSWHLDPEHNRDIFADDAAHAIDFIYWLFGMPDSVTAEMATLFDPRFENDIAVALFRYPDGKIVEVSGCFAATAGENTTEITAEHGVIIQNYGDSPSTSHKPPAWQNAGLTRAASGTCSS